MRRRYQSRPGERYVRAAKGSGAGPWLQLLPERSLKVNGLLKVHLTALFRRDAAFSCAVKQDIRSSPLKFENLHICSFLNVVHIRVLQTSSEPLIIKACALQTSQQCKYGQTTQLNLDIVSCVHKYGQEMRASFTVFSQS